MGFEFGVSKSGGTQRSSGESGVSRDDRRFATGEAFEVLRSARPLVEQFFSNVPQLNLTNGLTPGVANLAQQTANNTANTLFSRFSGSGASRGQLRPANRAGIIGNATERATAAVLPQLTQQAQQNELFNTTSQQNTQAQGLQFLQGLANLYTGLTAGGSQKSKGRTSAFGLNGGVSNGGGGFTS